MTTSLNDILSQVESDFLNGQGKITSIVDGTVIQAILAAYASNLLDLYDTLADTENQVFVDTATGSYLDRIANLVGCQRKGGEKATGTVTFSRNTPADNDILIPAGTKVRTQIDSNGNYYVFTTDSNVTLTKGLTSVDASITAEYVGTAYNLPSNSIIVMVDHIAGITAVTNANPTSGGVDVESDEDFRARIPEYISSLARGTKTALKVGAESVAGVGSATVVEGNPGSVNVYISATSGDVTQDLIDSVKTTLDDYRSAGVQVNVYGVLSIPVSVTATLSVKDGYSGVQTSVQNALIDFLNKKPQGDLVRENEIIAVIMDVEGVEDISSLSKTAHFDGTVLTAVGGETTANIGHEVIQSGYEVYKNDTLLTDGTDYTLDVNTGVITFTNALTANDVIKVVCDYTDTNIGINQFEKAVAGTVNVT